MRAGVMANRNAFDYLWPKPLLIDPKAAGYQQWRWLNFYFCLPRWFPVLVMVLVWALGLYLIMLAAMAMP